MRIAFLKGQGKQEFWKSKDVPSHQLCLHVKGPGPSFVWSSWQRLPCISRINHLTFQSVFIYYFTSSSQNPLPLSKNNYFPLHFIDPEWLIAWSSAQWTQQLQPFPMKPGSYWHLIKLTPPLLPSSAQKGYRHPSPRCLLLLSFLQGPLPSGHTSACQPFLFCILRFSLPLSVQIPLLSSLTSL